MGDYFLYCLNIVCRNILCGGKQNKIIHYYQYRTDPHDWTPRPAKPEKSQQKTTIIIDGKETVIDAGPEEIISTLMDQVDYNELLDFYGDPELR